jgi:hypothetical protein
MAMCVMAVVGDALCQCFSPAVNLIFLARRQFQSHDQSQSADEKLRLMNYQARPERYLCKNGTINT